MLISSNYFDILPVVGGSINSSEDTVLYYSYLQTISKFVYESASLSIVIQI